MTPRWLCAAGKVLPPEQVTPATFGSASRRPGRNCPAQKRTERAVELLSVRKGRGRCCGDWPMLGPRPGRRDRAVIAELCVCNVYGGSDAGWLLARIRDWSMAVCLMAIDGDRMLIADRSRGGHIFTLVLEFSHHPQNASWAPEILALFQAP